MKGGPPGDEPQRSQSLTLVSVTRAGQVASDSSGGDGRSQAGVPVVTPDGLQGPQNKLRTATFCCITYST